MTGRPNEPGTVTLEMANFGEMVVRVSAGPWQYATFLCWVPEGSERTTYAPLDNVVTWSKEVTS